MAQHAAVVAEGDAQDLGMLRARDALQALVAARALRTRMPQLAQEPQTEDQVCTDVGGVLDTFHPLQLVAAGRAWTAEGPPPLRFIAVRAISAVTAAGVRHASRQRNMGMGDAW